MTAVVAVMHFFGKTNCDSHNTDTEISAKEAKLGLNLKRKGPKQFKLHKGKAQQLAAGAIKRLLVKKAIRVLLNTVLSGDLLFTNKNIY